MAVSVQKITPFLWFDTQAEEVVSISRYPEGPLEGPMKGMEGKVLTAVFLLAGEKFMALDGGPVFRFTEAVSLYVDCSSQAEVDYFWGKLSTDPNAEQCGWLKDRFGLSWQVVPSILEMKKLDIAALKKAHAA